MVYFGSSIANADSSKTITNEEFSEVLTLRSDGTCVFFETYPNGASGESFLTYTATQTEITLIYGIGHEDPVLSYEISGDTLTTTQHFEAIIDDQHDEPETWFVTTFIKI